MHFQNGIYETNLGMGILLSLFGRREAGKVRIEGDDGGHAGGGQAAAGELTADYRVGRAGQPEPETESSFPTSTYERYVARGREPLS